MWSVVRRFIFDGNLLKAKTRFSAPLRSSTGGGAMLKLLETGRLVGVEVLAND